MMRQGNEVVVPIADLRAGETRKVVLHRRSIRRARASSRSARLALHWRRVSDNQFDSTRTQLDTTVVRDVTRVQATIDRSAVSIVEQARAARARASDDVLRDPRLRSREHVERNLRDVKSNAQLDAPSVQAIEAAVWARWTTSPRERRRRGEEGDAPTRASCTRSQTTHRRVIRLESRAQFRSASCTGRA